MKHLTALLISIAVIVFSIVMGNAYRYKYKQTERISVTGAAETSFTSDLIVWSATYSRSSSILQDAFNELKADEQKVKNYLSQQELSDTEIVYSSVNIEKLYNTTYDDNGRITGSLFAGYR